MLAFISVFAATSYVADSAKSDPGGNRPNDVGVQGLSERHLLRCRCSLREITFIA